MGSGWRPQLGCRVNCYSCRSGALPLHKDWRFSWGRVGVVHSAGIEMTHQDGHAADGEPESNDNRRDQQDALPYRGP